MYKLTFEQTTTRDPSGKIVVTIPLKDNLYSLGESKPVAIRRFYALEKRLEKSPEIKRAYTDFMDDYRNLGHMTEITDNSDVLEYFLPHHHVLRESSITTKLRVVFDGSFKTSSNKSFNDVQYIRHMWQSDLFPILIRFRRYKFVAIADIEKMYRQILVHPSQRALQKIVWRDNQDEKLLYFQLNSHLRQRRCPLSSNKMPKILGRRKQANLS